MIERHNYVMNKTYQTNVSELYLNNKLETFYENNKDKHFWFQRALIGPTMKFMIVEETRGHLWWKHKEKKCYFLESNCNALEPRLITTMSDFLCQHLPVGMYVDIVTNTMYYRFIDDKVYLTYDYYVTKMGTVSDGEMAPDKMIENCNVAKLNGPQFEDGEFVFLSLGKIFKTYESFVKYVLECKEMKYELILCLAQEERDNDENN